MLYPARIYELRGVSSGPSQPEFLYTSADEYQIKLTAEGIYYFTAEATGPDGNIYQDTMAIVVLNKTQLDALLKGKWEGMKSKLMNQDVEGAVSYFTEESKQLYNDIFTALNAQLPQLAQDMQDIQLMYVKNNTAKYRIRRNELYGGQILTITYYIYFGLDRDGIWRIYRY